ncbi:MAG: ABC transporter permease [Anaerolineales bacterium]|nr:ABC transporter permease [Anaerolineales bacterium]MBM2847453.1 transporter permease [Anaerolineales bacterium]
MPYVKRILSGWAEALLPVAAVALALLIGAGMLLALGADPLKAYSAMLQGAAGSVSGITQTLVKATPLLLVGLGITIAFRGGVINIGGEGQLIVGALAATAMALAFPEWPGVILLPLALAAGVAGGAAWGGVPGVLKARLGVNEILSTIMMNQIAIQLSNYLLRGPMIDPAEIARGTQIAQSAQLPQQVWLIRLVPRTLLNGGAIIAVVMAVLVYIFLWRTTIGYRIRAVGLNAEAARYAGIRVPVYQALALVLGGAFAGLAGAVEVLGVQHRMMEGLSGGYGFSGIVAALFGKLHPLGAIPASILFGGLLVGADKMQRAVQVPSALIGALQGLVVLFVVSSDIWARYRARRRQTYG